MALPRGIQDLLGTVGRNHDGGNPGIDGGAQAIDGLGAQSAEIEMVVRKDQIRAELPAGNQRLHIGKVTHRLRVALPSAEKSLHRLDNARVVINDQHSGMCKTDRFGRVGRWKCFILRTFR